WLVSGSIRVGQLSSSARSPSAVRVGGAGASGGDGRSDTVRTGKEERRLCRMARAGSSHGPARRRSGERRSSGLSLLQGARQDAMPMQTTLTQRQSNLTPSSDNGAGSKALLA